MRYAAAVFAILLSAPVLAQVNYRPTDPPIVSAENESWYRLGEPLIFAGELYYPAGPVVFFNGDVMVPTGHYNGIPIYVDTTIEPYSIVLVPIGRGQLQPYERRRDGNLAGTSGSRPPSFPGGPPYSSNFPAAGAVSPTNLPLPIGAIGAFTPEPGVSLSEIGVFIPQTGAFIPEAGAVSTAGSSVPSTAGTPSQPVRQRPGRPFRYDNISFQFKGEKWVMAGPSVSVLPEGMEVIAEHKGFPVFAAPGREHARVYLPITPARFAPFRPAKP